MKLLLKIVLWIIALFISLGVGAELEAKFPDEPVTEIWGFSMLALIILFLVRWATKSDRKRATKLLSETGFYSESSLASMSGVELLARERRHKLDMAKDWSTCSFKELIDMEKADKAAALAVKAATQAREDASRPREKKFVCAKCGVKLGEFQRGYQMFGGKCEMGGKCVPHEVPEGY